MPPAHAWLWVYKAPSLVGVTPTSGVQVLITVILNGGGTYYLLKRWNLQAGAVGSAGQARELDPILSGGRQPSTPMGAHEMSLGSPPVTCGFASSTNGSRCVRAASKVPCNNACQCTTVRKQLCHVC